MRILVEEKVLKEEVRYIDTKPEKIREYIDNLFIDYACDETQMPVGKENINEWLESMRKMISNAMKVPKELL